MKMLEHVVREECGCGNNVVLTQHMDYTSETHCGAVTSGKAKKHRRGKKKGGSRHQWKALNQLEEQSIVSTVPELWSPPRRLSPKPSESDSEPTEADRVYTKHYLIKAAERLDRRNKYRLRPNASIPAPANSNQFLMADNENCQQFDEQFERLYGSSSEECEYNLCRLKPCDDEFGVEYIYDYANSHYFTDYEEVQNRTLAEDLAMKPRSELIECINNLNDVLSQSENLQSEIPEAVLREYYRLKAENNRLQEENRLLQNDH